jgi:hypothetical protein
MESTKFKPGMLVAYGECHQGKMTRVIVLYTVKIVGKKLIKLNGGTGNYRLSGQSTDPVYQNRWIMPVTKALYAQAQADKASGLDLALGRVISDEVV